MSAATLLQAGAEQVEQRLRDAVRLAPPSRSASTVRAMPIERSRPIREAALANEELSTDSVREQASTS